MMNTKFKDMIERLSSLLNHNLTFLFTIFQGKVHTYVTRADLIAQLPRLIGLDIPEKSPVVVYGGQEYEMLATFVA